MSRNSDDSSLESMSDTEEVGRPNDVRPPSHVETGRTSQTMPPLRTGRNTPLSDRMSVGSRDNSANLNRHEPLPPIRSTASAHGADDDELPSDESSDELEKVSAAMDDFNDQIVSVSEFNDHHLHHQSSATSAGQREVTTRLASDGREIEMISIDIQTEVNMAATPDVVQGIKTEIKSGRQIISRIGSSQAQDAAPLDDASENKLDAFSEDKTQADETSSMPWPPRDDEFGVPLLELSSDSEVSDDEDGKTEFDKEEENIGNTYSDTLPSVGPPEILKYIRESDRIDIAPDSSTQSFEGDSSSSVTGVCEFCKQPIKPFPTLEQQETLPPEQLYCCEEYRNFVHFALNIPTDDLLKQDYKIDIKPHAHYGSKQARRIAKERATMRLRERELMRQQQAVAAGMPTQQSAFYNFAKQMKTINYQLSSQKCQDEGWTHRVPTPAEEREPEPQAFAVEPMDWPGPEEDELGQDPLAYDALGRKIFVRNIIERYYDNGSKFLTVFPDGTGHVFYPSGNIAISISSVARGQFRYVVLDDSTEKRVVILAMFEPSGIGTCNYKKGGAPRLYFDQLGGVELDHEGSQKKKWHWRDKAHHVHAPPFQPICMSMNKYISLRVMSQENIAMQFMTKRRSCRFNVGVRLKLVNSKYLPIEEVDDNKLYIQEKLTTIEAMMDKIANMLRYPRSTKVTKIKPPLYLTSKAEKNERLAEKSKRQKEEAAERQKNANYKPIVLVT